MNNIIRFTVGAGAILVGINVAYRIKSAFDELKDELEVVNAELEDVLESRDLAVRMTNESIDYLSYDEWEIIQEHRRSKQKGNLDSKYVI